jgi:hypothetical protein
LNRESIYWYFVLLTFIYILYKNRKNSIKVLIVLCFYSGLAAFFGKGIENSYKVGLVLFSIYVLLKYHGLSGLNKKGGLLLLVFVLFSVSFLYSTYINGDYFKLIFSQYGKYVTPICLFFVFNSVLIKDPRAFISLRDLFFTLLTTQILLSAVKIFTIGVVESTVGSLSFTGGGVAAEVPVLGFILLWLQKRGEFKRKDWIYTFLLLLIGVASVKRAIWFIMPVIVFLFMYYVNRKLKIGKVWYFLPIVPFIFYLGVRLNPSLNREGRVGGSFDLQFAIDYVQSYNFGKTKETSDIQLGQGRGGATFLLFEKAFNSKSLSFNDFWGSGLQQIYTTNYEQFDNEKYGVNSKGAVTGVFQTYIVSGFIGVIFTILLIFSILYMIKEPRIRTTIAILMFWDYLFYSGLILRMQSLLILLFFIITYANLQFEERLNKDFTTIDPGKKKGIFKPQQA